MADNEAIDAEPQLKIVQAKLLVTRHLKDSTDNQLFHNHVVHTPATWHFVRPIIKGPFLVPKDNTVLDITISNGCKPNQLLFFFLEPERYNGDFSEYV